MASPNYERNQMVDYTRTVQPEVEAALFKGKVIVIYGARHVGKTTLCRSILRNYPQGARYLNCDEPDIRAALTERTSTELRALIGAKTLVVIDEAQRVRNIGLTLKLLVDKNWAKCARSISTIWGCATPWSITSIR